MSNAEDFKIKKGVLIKYVGPGEDVVIKEGVTSIGDQAFRDCNSLTRVYYKGSVSDWNNVYIGDWGSNYLTNATRYYYSESQPTEEGNYWHYDENGEIAVW